MSNKLTVSAVMQDFERAWMGKKSWMESAKEDYEVRMGKQWKAEDKAKLEADGRPALTINHIHSMINLLYGIESQNRTDPKAFPEGMEDDVKGEIATRLLKHMGKRDWLPFKISEQFEHGVTTGECFLEPWLDFSKDILFGQFRVKRLDFNQIFPDPDSREYDLSDAEFIDKLTYNLTADQLTSIYPDSEKQIKDVLERGVGRVKFDMLGSGLGGKSVDNPALDYEKDAFWGGGESNRKVTGDLLEHYYKKYVPAYHVIDMRLERVQQTSDKDEAERYKQIWGDEATAAGVAPGMAAEPGKPKEIVRIVKRMVPEIWVCAVLGGEILEDKRAWFYPRWQSFHFIPFWCYKLDVPLDGEDRAMLCQGFVRQLKDPQFERNKRESQLLHHLNCTVGGSALEWEAGSLENEDEVKNHGAAPGANIIRKKGAAPVVRHNPAQLSTGHLVMSDRHADNIKTVSGMNPDLLAMQDGGQASGRAIALRQKQGSMMVQKPFDHLARTKWIFYQFQMSQLGEVYDVERAAKVLGEEFMKLHFTRPQVVPTEDGNGGQVMAPAIGPDKKPIYFVDLKMAMATINQVLNDAGVAEYDVAVGETMTTETTQLGNYLTMQDMRNSGIQIPPDVLIGASGLAASDVKKIIAYNERMQAAAAEAARGAAGAAGGK